MFKNRVTFVSAESDLQQKSKTVTSEKKFYTVTDKNHAAFDLQRLYIVIGDVVSSMTFQDCLITELKANLSRCPEELLLDIRNVLCSRDYGIYLILCVLYSLCS